GVGLYGWNYIEFFSFMGNRKQLMQRLFALIFVSACLTLSGCGGGGTPAPTPAPTPTPAPAPACPGESWTAILACLNVQAMSLQLAKHCILDAVDEQQVVLCLSQEHKHLQTKMATDNLRAALTTYYAKPMKLLIKLDENVVTTPAKIEHQTRQDRQQQANDSIKQDNFVRDAQENLGATLMAESVKAIN
ncbi:MAG: DNA polymerase III subunit gamma/tau C-terminal domain-containing protein, partial [Gallionella sp.]